MKSERANIIGRIGLATLIAAYGTATLLAQTGAPSFQAPRFAPFNHKPPWGVAIADIDNDGDRDIAVGGTVIAVVSVYRNNGNWSGPPPSEGLDDPVDYLLAPSGAQGDIGFANINPTGGMPDNLIDLVVVDASAVYVLLNNPNSPGTFIEPATAFDVTELIGSPVGLALIDLDSNNRVDIALAGVKTFPQGTLRPTLAVLWGRVNLPYTSSFFRLDAEFGLGYDLAAWTQLYTGGASLMAPPLPPTDKFVAMTNSGDPRLHVFRFSGSQTPTIQSFDAIESLGITAANFTPSESLVDAAYTFDTPQTDFARWSRHKSTPAPFDFEPRTEPYPVSLNPVGIASGILNSGDPLIDIVIANRGDETLTNPGNVSVLTSSTVIDGMFSIPYNFPVLPSSMIATPVQVAVGDINNDGRQDIVTANQGEVGFDDDGETVTVLLRNP